MADLTGTWDGSFAYPSLLEPEPFVAQLSQTDEWVTGSIDEGADGQLSSQAQRPSTIMGRYTASVITFAKSYDQPCDERDIVSYEGTVSDDGGEISGTWNIPGNWSGSFVMVRRNGVKIAEEKVVHQAV